MHMTKGWKGHDTDSWKCHYMYIVPIKQGPLPWDSIVALLLGCFWFIATFTPIHADIDILWQIFIMWYSHIMKTTLLFFLSADKSLLVNTCQNFFIVGFYSTIWNDSILYDCIFSKMQNIDIKCRYIFASKPAHFGGYACTCRLPKTDNVYKGGCFVGRPNPKVLSRKFKHKMTWIYFFMNVIFWKVRINLCFIVK